jgi:hypothetical protein
MKSSESYKPASNLAILLVGDQKTGKTNVAMAFPDPYFLDLDKNLDSAVRVAGGKKFWYDQPTESLDMSDPKQAAHVYPIAMDMLKKAAVDPQVKTLVIDSLSTLTIHMVSYILGEASRIENKRIEQMRIQDYGTVMGLLQKLVAFLRATNKIVVVTSHQSWDKDDVTGAIRYTLAVPGQMKHNLGAFLTDVWGLMVTQAGGGKCKYEIRTRPSGFHVSLGTSVRSLPPNIDITDKTPIEIGKLLLPQLGLTV